MKSEFWDMAISKKLSILFQLTWINYWRSKFLKNHFWEIIFFQKMKSRSIENHEIYKAKNSIPGFGEIIAKNVNLAKPTSIVGWRLYFSKNGFKHLKNVFVCMLLVICPFILNLQMDKCQLVYNLFGQLQTPMTLSSSTQKSFNTSKS